jgi:uncharacterized protein (DUF58 family)
MGTLFTQDFVRAVERLRIIARQVPRGGRHAEHRSLDLGGGMEFRDFRSYVPGDDPRRVDWNLYRRSGRLFLRLFEEPEELAVYVLLDVSDSMFFEAPSRADAGRQMAAVLAGIALNQHDRITVYPFGADLGSPCVAASGRPALPRMLEYLEHLGPLGPTDFGRSLRRFASARQRSGLAVVISDFFDPRGLDAVIGALRGLRHRLLLVQVIRDSDASPAVEGEIRFIDCESGARVDVTVTRRELERYRQRYRAFCDRLLGFVARRQASHLRLNAERPILEQLGDLFVDGVFAA